MSQHGSSENDQSSSSSAADNETPLPSAMTRLGLAMGRTFFNGLIAILPIGATIIVLMWLADLFEGIFEPPIRHFLFLAGLEPKDRYITGMGFILGLVVIFLLGLAVKAYMVRQLLRGSESLLQRLPIARTVMSSVRDVTGFFTSGERKQMSQVVMVRLRGLGGGMEALMTVDSKTEHPGTTVPGAELPGVGNPGAGHPGAEIGVIGFVTRGDLRDLPAAAGAGGRVAVYVPLSYALGGVTLLVPRSSLEPLDMTMEQAMRFMLTAGMKSENKPG